MLSTASDKGSHALRIDLSTVRASGCISMRSVICTVPLQLFSILKHQFIFIIVIPTLDPYTGNVNSETSKDSENTFVHFGHVFGESWCYCYCCCWCSALQGNMSRGSCLCNLSQGAVQAVDKLSAVSKCCMSCQCCFKKTDC